MATVVGTGTPSAGKTSTGRRGVQPLRPGQGHSFFWRRLHSISGIVPIGAFLLEHFLSNAAASNGPHAYAEQVKFLSGLPFLVFLEFFLIWLPITYHALYGIWIWYRGDANLRAYPWTSNWLYTLQRWTGIIALAYIIQHVYFLRFSGTHLIDSPGAAFAKVQHELENPWLLVWYAAGILSACWHFGYGIFLFCTKWGIVSGKRARMRLRVVSIIVFAGLSGIGFVTLASFLKPQWRNQYVTDSLTDRSKAKAIEAGDDPMSQKPSQKTGNVDAQPQQQ